MPCGRPQLCMKWAKASILVLEEVPKELAPSLPDAPLHSPFGSGVLGCRGGTFASPLQLS